MLITQSRLLPWQYDYLQFKRCTGEFWTVRSSSSLIFTFCNEIYTASTQLCGEITFSTWLKLRNISLKLGERGGRELSCEVHDVINLDSNSRDIANGQNSLFISVYKEFFKSYLWIAQPLVISLFSFYFSVFLHATTQLRPNLLELV